MASIGQIIFWSMIVLIFVMAGFLILLLAIAFSVSQGSVSTDNSFPVANLKQDVVLDCSFRTKTGSSSPDVLITWKKEGLAGVVYQYQKNTAQLQDQNTQFRDRVQLFPNAISGGNASLLLRSVTTEDEGVYRCSVSAPGVWGTVSIHLRVGAFSAPNINMSNNSLTAEAERWLPKPDVIWFNQNDIVLKSSTQFEKTTAGFFQVISNLEDKVITGETYTCVIENLYVKAISEAEVTSVGVSPKTYFIFSSSPKMLSSQLVSAAPVVLYMLAR